MSPSTDPLLGQESEPDPLIVDSFLWGLLSAVSLNIGSLIGVTCLPTQKTRAILMSFGGGALLFALSIELFGHTLHEFEETGETATVWAMEASAVAGGLLFAFLNHALNLLGADVRKPSTTKHRFARLRRLLARRLVARLRKIPLFAALSQAELHELVHTAMVKSLFTPGEIIMSSETRDCGIFFIISGLVRLEVFDHELGNDIVSPPSGPTSPSSGAGPSPPAARPDGPAPDEFGASPSKRSLRKSQTQVSLAGGPLSTWDLGPNQIFGDMTLLTGSHMQCEAVALQSTKVLSLPRHEVARLLKQHTALREAMSLRAVERLRLVPELHSLPNTLLASLSARSSMLMYQPGQIVFRGAVEAHTPLICLLLGSVKLIYHRTRNERIVHACCLLCTEHLKGNVTQPYTCRAVEATSVLVIQRGDLKQAMALQDAANEYLDVESTTTPRSASSEELEEVLASPYERPPIPAPEDKESRAPSLLSITPRSACGGRSLDGEAMGIDGIDTECVGHPLAPDLLPGQVWTSLVEDGRSQSGASARRGVRRHRSELQHIGANLGWSSEDSDSSDEDHMLSFMDARRERNMVQVTDFDLQERELTTPAARRPSYDSAQRLHSKDSSSSRRPAPPPEAGEEAGAAGAPVAAAADSHEARGRHRAMMVWLGILIDAVPESLVIGILINKTATTEKTSVPSRDAAAAVLPFVMGVFLSNLPESMSSSGSMKAHGMRVSTILIMWMATTVLTAAGASLGAVLFPPGSATDQSSEIAIASVEGLAAGAMLTMIAQTMMPEAFEQGGDIVGLSCLMGFLCALSVKLIPI